MMENLPIVLSASWIGLSRAANASTNQVASEIAERVRAMMHMSLIVSRNEHDMNMDQ